MTFKFSENETVEDIEDVDANLRAFYHKPEGAETYSVREELQSSAAAWDGLSGANQKIRKDNKALLGKQTDLSALSEYGDSTDSILASFTSQKQELSDALEAKKGAVNPEKLRTQILEGFAEKEKQYVAKTEALQSQLYNTLVTSEVQSAISKEKGDMDLLTPFVTSQVNMVEYNGQLVARVMDSDGEVKFGATGTEMTVQELVSNMKKDKKFAKLYESDALNGGGPPPNQLNSSGPRNTAQRTATDKISAGLAKMSS